MHGRIKIEKVEKLVANLDDKNNNFTRDLKQVYHHELVLKKLHGVLNSFKKLG